MDTDETKITIFGAGYVGLTTAVLFANAGLSVCLVEVNTERLKVLQQGKSFFYEAGIDSLLKNVIENKKLSLTNGSEKALKDADVIFSCVGTPDNPDGSSNLSYVFSVAESVAQHARENAVFVQKSTVPVQTGEKIEELFRQKNRSIHYVSNPEFLREGTAILDSLWFDRIVVGSDNQQAAETILRIYKNVEEARDEISRIAQIDAPIDKTRGRYIKTNRNSAELIKVTANAFLATKISFANSIAKLADKTGADVNDVMEAVGADSRIGADFLNAGRGYGGGCFPKDASGLITSAAEHGVDMPIVHAAQEINDSMPGYIAEKIQEYLDGDIAGKRIAILGLAFKAGTSDVRKSPGIKLANLLAEFDARVNAHDPHANEEASADLHASIKVYDNIIDCVKKVDCVIIATNWEDFKAFSLEEYERLMTGKLFVDAMNFFKSEDVRSNGLQYIGVGRR